MKNKSKEKRNIQANISRKIINRIVIGLVWFVIPLLFLISILLAFELWNSKVNIIEKGIFFFGIIFILTFALILIILSTKYRKEMLLNNTERRKKWRFLRKDFHNFYKKMIIFESLLFLFMVITGIIQLNSEKFSGVILIIVGILLFVSTVRSIMELKKLERK